MSGGNMSYMNYLEDLDALPVVALANIDAEKVILYTDATPPIVQDGPLLDPPLSLNQILKDAGFRLAPLPPAGHHGLTGLTRFDAGLHYKVVLAGFGRVPDSKTRLVLFGDDVGPAASDVGRLLLYEGYFATVEPIDGTLFDLV